MERIEQRVRRHIVPHLGAQPLNAIGTEVLRHWKKRLEKDLGPTSIRLAWATLSSVLQAAVEDRRLGRNPCRSSTVGPPAATPGRVEAWQPERVLAVREALPDRYRLLLVISAGLGLRQGGRSGLPWRTSTSPRKSSMYGGRSRWCGRSSVSRFPRVARSGTCPRRRVWPGRFGST
ncbi:hypothetical protein AB0E17_31410 [Streptomyces niveus]